METKRSMDALAIEWPVMTFAVVRVPGPSVSVQPVAVIRLMNSTGRSWPSAACHGRPPVITNDGDIMLEALCAGVGIGCTTEALVADDVASGRLVPLRKTWWPSFPLPSS